MLKYFAAVFILVLSLSWALPVSARLGVGVGTGALQVDEDLRPGGIYDLPPISVFNTGDETAEYAMSAAWHEDQEEKRPAEEWFRFTPERFELDPDEAQTVEVQLHMPVRVEPGDYFAYVEAGPLQFAESGESTIGLAAATKLNFTVAPANLLWALYYKALGIWRDYAPWTYIGLGAVSAAGAFLLLRNRFRIRPRKIKLD